jgi:hypothetical protein
VSGRWIDVARADAVPAGGSRLRRRRPPVAVFSIDSDISPFTTSTTTANTGGGRGHEIVCPRLCIALLTAHGDVLSPPAYEAVRSYRCASSGRLWIQAEP